ncbi:MAG: hypothetical protein IT221_05985 [Fluviicola sp.]|nr:hypothetical protein [Fluviicola sp.]
MKKLLGILTLLFALSSNAQSWKFIGSTSGIGDGTEVDMEISNSGTLYIAYIDALNSNKITVKNGMKQHKLGLVLVLLGLVMRMLPVYN